MPLFILFQFLLDTLTNSVLDNQLLQTQILLFIFGAFMFAVISKTRFFVFSITPRKGKILFVIRLPRYFSLFINQINNSSVSASTLSILI